jgi:hypothetical protein
VNVEKVGIKETKEAVVALNEISLFVASRLKDGVGLDDATALFAKVTGDEEFQKLVAAAYENYKAIPAEVKDVDVLEGVELGMLQLGYLPKFVEALKK